MVNCYTCQDPHTPENGASCKSKCNQPYSVLYLGARQSRSEVSGRATRAHLPDSWVDLCHRVHTQENTRDQCAAPARLAARAHSARRAAEDKAHPPVAGRRPCTPVHSTPAQTQHRGLVGTTCASSHPRKAFAWHCTHGEAPRAVVRTWQLPETFPTPTPLAMCTANHPAQHPPTVIATRGVCTAGGQWVANPRPTPRSSIGVQHIRLHTRQLPSEAL